MNEDLLMDLADCGSPEALISVFLRHHPELQAPVPVEDLALEVGIIEFRELEVDGFEGALMTNETKTQGVVLTKAGSRKPRRRFTVGHELGHFLIPSHRGDRQCTAADLRERRMDTQHQRQEAEANRFSAGLLMPKPWFLRDMRELGDAEVTHVQKLAKKYETSLEATTNRYAELSDDACAFVFSKDGIIRYVRRSSGFPWLSLKRGDLLPDQCASKSTHSLPLRVPSSWAEVDASVWLEGQAERRAQTVLEQSMQQKDGYQITLLFVDQEEQEELDEEDLEERWTPRFHR